MFCMCGVFVYGEEGGRAEEGFAEKFALHFVVSHTQCCCLVLEHFFFSDLAAWQLHTLP